MEGRHVCNAAMSGTYFGWSAKLRVDGLEAISSLCKTAKNSEPSEALNFLADPGYEKMLTQRT